MHFGIKVNFSQKSQNTYIRQGFVGKRFLRHNAPRILRKNIFFWKFTFFWTFRRVFTVSNPAREWAPLFHLVLHGLRVVFAKLMPRAPARSGPETLCAPGLADVVVVRVVRFCFFVSVGAVVGPEPQTLWKPWVLREFVRREKRGSNLFIFLPFCGPTHTYITFIMTCGLTWSS